jgi:methionyl aminopeptidase
VHGIPDDYRLRDGDLVSVDFAAEVDGWHADAATSWVVGDGAADDTVLIDTARRALDAAIEVARPGRRIGDIAHVIGQIGRSAGYGIPPDFGGHGVGRAMHESPGVPNEGPAGRGYPLKPGLVIAIEPMFLAGGRDQYTVDRDGWTLRTADGSRAAHVEHTIAVMDDGPALVLTADS